MRTARSLTVSLSMLCIGRRGVPGLGVYLVPGGVYLVPGGVVYLVRGCTWFEGVYWGVYLVQGGVPGPRRVYLVLGGDVPGPGGCTWSQGVYLIPGGVCSQGGVPGPRGGLLQVLGGVCSRSGGCQVLPPVNRMTDACKTITLPKLRCRR